MDGHFPESLHDEIRDAVGIPRTWVVREAPLPPRRDPAFRDEVLREYQRRCAVCDFDVRLGNELIGLEAAHIKWHAAGGPDEVANGLALCGLHHKAFDRGALGLEPIEAGATGCWSRARSTASAPRSAGSSTTTTVRFDLPGTPVLARTPGS